MSKEPIYCQHCQKQTKYGIDTFARWHLKKEHNMTMKEYYDLYMKKENEEFCKMCGEHCGWENSTKGYYTYCSPECMRIDPEWQESHKAGVNAQDKEAALEKRRATCKDKYGTDNVSQNEVVKQKMFGTNKERYGSHVTLGLSQVKEARNKALDDNSEEINDKRIAWWSEDNKQKVNKTRITTLLKRYGVENLFSTEEMKEQIRNTNYESGYWTLLEHKSEWEQYCYYVQEETKKHVRELFGTWNGNCYYFGHNLTLDTSDYDPYSVSIDHKISKKHGFTHGIPPEEIGALENLCICSRLINCIKNTLTEEEFLKSERYHKYKRSLHE